MLGDVVGDNKGQLGRIEKKLESLAENFEKAHFTEYIEYVHNRRRLYRNAFVLGIFRGLGTAVGFSLLGALVIYILRAVAKTSIPVLGEFIAEVIRIVDGKLKG